MIRPEQGSAREQIAPRRLIERNDKKQDGFFQDRIESWYRLTAPSEPGSDVELSVRETYRRGRLTSTVLLIFLLLAFAFIPVAIFSASKFLLPLMLVVIIVVLVSLLFNRYGKITAAGIILVASVEIAFMISLKTQRGGLSVYNLPTLDMLVLPELLAVSLLSGESIFVLAVLNSVFIWVALNTGFVPHASDLQVLLHQVGYNLVVRPIIIQILVAIVTFLWVRSTQRAIARADRAEVIAQLEHAIAQQEHKAAQEKRQLDASIEQIVQAHTQIANGNYAVRIPLRRENVLWQIAGSLNNLLARLQRYRQDSQQNQQLLHEINELTMMARQARAQGQPFRFKRTGTSLDALVLELATSAAIKSEQELRTQSGRLSPGEE